MGSSRQEYWIGLPVPSPGDLPNPGIKPGSPSCRQILYHLIYHQGSPRASSARTIIKVAGSLRAKWWKRLDRSDTPVLDPAFCAGSAFTLMAELGNMGVVLTPRWLSCLPQFCECLHTLPINPPFSWESDSICCLTKNSSFFSSHTSLEACGTLVPRRGTVLVHPTAEARSLNHWATREVPEFFFKLNFTGV